MLADRAHRVQLGVGKPKVLRYASLLLGPSGAVRSKGQACPQGKLKSSDRGDHLAGRPSAQAFDSPLASDPTSEGRLYFFLRTAM